MKMLKQVLVACGLLVCLCPVLAAEWDLGRNGVDIRVTASPEAVDPARDFFVTVVMTAAADVAIPDLRDRFQGFQIAEDFSEEPVVQPDGRRQTIARWRLVPEPCVKQYSLRPFVVKDFYTAPVVFAPPAARESVTGAMEVDPHKDLPPLSWKLVGLCAVVLLACALLVWGLWVLVRRIRQAVRVHRMSPVQRAYWELERLLAKGLPGRGRYKDFYVELTMVVRRYVQRKYGIRAPNLTTEEFFAELRDSGDQTPEQTARLKTFLESADLIKFAGVEATPEMADAAVESARTYVARDDALVTPVNKAPTQN